MYECHFLKAAEIDRFPVTGAKSLDIRYDCEATRRLASCVARGPYQRAVLDGSLPVRTSGSYRGSCASLLAKLRGEGLDVGCVVDRGRVVYLIGEANTLRLCARQDIGRFIAV